MEDAGRWALLDAHLPADLRTLLEDRYWRPIEVKASIEALEDDASFWADPGSHPAMFADHGTVHARDVAAGLVRLIETVDGVLLAARPAERRRFMQAYGVGAVYLHDIGMVDMSLVGRRTHPAYGAHAAFWASSDPLVEHLLRPGPVRARLDAVAAAAPFAVPLETVVRELLSLTAAHSKSTIPAPILDDRDAFRAAMRRIVLTSLGEQRAATGLPGADDLPPAIRDATAGSHYPDPGLAFAWLSAPDGPQAELADDAVDTIRALRAADVLRQRGTALRTSGGYEVCFDARTADAVCTIRPSGLDAIHVITYDDHRGAGEANIRVAFVTPDGNLRIAFHRGGFASREASHRAALSVANAVEDIIADVVPSFGGRPARCLPSPAGDASKMRVQLERPDDMPAFADEVIAVIADEQPALAPILETASNVEGAASAERERYHAAARLDAEGTLARQVVERLAAHGTAMDGLGAADAFAEVRLARLRPGEVLLARGSAPSFVYVPMGAGLHVHPDGGYAAAPVHAWVPVGTTGVIRHAERNSDIVAEQEVDVAMIPGDRYLDRWYRPRTPGELRSRLRAGAGG